MKKSILIPIIIATVGLTGVSAFAATTTSSAPTSPPSSMNHMFGERGEHGGKMMMTLTDAEKTSLQTMTAEQKQAFFDKKRAEMESKMTAHENVIDKLLAGQTLTADEETLRKTIIQERATRKAEMTAMKAKMDQLKSIRDKQKAGTTLTADEQKLVDSMPQSGRDGRGHGNGIGFKAKSTTRTTE